MSKHQNLPHDWKFRAEFRWDTSMGDSLLRMRTGWTIKDHSEESYNEKINTYSDTAQQ